MASRITSDGRVRIPKDILETLDVGPGGEVDFKRGADGAVVLEKVSQPSRRQIDWEKVIGSAGPGLSTDEVMKLLRGDD
ncbi:AbrB/MazE/SpoVT family DNA-binding domain-containing protein [Rhodopseudomonas pseudopalustris]|nr:AbrB/MazE/SpoVT family DNA-binding domain-containing protein [Rhodopseudomonas pseudopalustris]SEP36110.1 transcriptional regulator, AbrB family [Rhodopseudomonas pseudopalustris]